MQYATDTALVVPVVDLLLDTAAITHLSAMSTAHV